MLKHQIFVVFLSFIFLSGCIGDPIKDLVKVIDKAIVSLETESGDFKGILEKALNDIPDEIQSTIRNDVTNSLKLGIGAAGVELRCNIDSFLKNNILFDLKALKKSILEKKPYQRSPKFCQVTPNQVHLGRIRTNNQENVSITGYNMKHSDLKIFIEDEANKKRDVSNSLNRVTSYELSLNLGNGAGAIGRTIKDTDRRIIVSVGDNVLSEIGIFVPPPPPPPPPPNISTRYQIIVTTGNIENAGTDAGVYIKLVGSHGTTKEFKLDTRGHDDFQRNSRRSYFIDARRDIGVVERVHMRQSNHGDRPGWHLAKVKVINKRTDASFNFICNKWLADSAGTLSRTLKTSGCS